MRPKNLFISRWEEYTAMLGLAQSNELCELLLELCSELLQLLSACFDIAYILHNII